MSRQSREDCVIHHGPYDWVQRDLDEGHDVYGCRVTLRAPINFYKTSGRLIRCTITSAVWPAYRYYYSVGEVPDANADLNTVMRLNGSGTVFIGPEEQRTEFFYNPAIVGNLGRLRFRP